MEDYTDECICSGWDGKGWSTCGVPCPMHCKESPEEIGRIMAENRKAELQFIKDVRSGKLKGQELDF